MTRMNDDQLRAITDGEMRQAVGFWSGKLAMQRQKAMVYYLGLAKLDLSPCVCVGGGVTSPSRSPLAWGVLPLA